MCHTQQIEKLVSFIKSFGSSYDGQGCEANYAKFTGVDRATVNKIVNGKLKPNALHYKIMDLMTERNELKKTIRQMKRG